MIGNSLEVSKFNRLFLKLNRFICNLLTVLPRQCVHTQFFFPKMNSYVYFRVKILWTDHSREWIIFDFHLSYTMSKPHELHRIILLTNWLIFLGNFSSDRIQPNLINTTLVYATPSILQHIFVWTNFLVQNCHFYTTTTFDNVTFLESLLFHVKEVVRFNIPFIYVMYIWKFPFSLGNYLGTSLNIGNSMIIKVTGVEWTWLGLGWHAILEIFGFLFQEFLRIFIFFWSYKLFFHNIYIA
jgi:hypothetical protein